MSRPPNEVLELGAKIARELRLEPTDTLGKWMAHHLAEVLQEADRADGDEKEPACARAVDLILKLWSHKRGLPRGAYPLNDLEPAISILGRLSSRASPFFRNGSNATEQLLSRIFDGLRLVVIHGVILISKTETTPKNHDVTDAFLDDDERRLLDVFEGWKDYVRTGVPKPSLIILTEQERADYEAERAEIAELEKMDPKSRSNRILLREINSLMKTLSKLKKRLVSDEQNPKKE